MRSVLRDPEHQSHFERFGWVKVPFLSGDEILALQRGFEGIRSRFAQGWTTTFVADDPEIKAVAAAVIKPVFMPRMHDLLADYVVLSSNFNTKGSSDESVVDYHQHCSFVDESRGFVAPNIFCPLVATNNANGNLFVVSGTHRLPRHPRPALCQEDSYGAYWRLFEEQAVPVPTALGEAIVFDNLLIHGSPPNRTPEMRVVASVVAVPAEADPVVYYREADGRLAMCGVDEEFLIANPFRSVRSNRVIGRLSLPPVGDIGPQIHAALGIESSSSGAARDLASGSPGDARPRATRAGLSRWFARGRHD